MKIHIFLLLWCMYFTLIRTSSIFACAWYLWRFHPVNENCHYAHSFFSVWCSLWGRQEKDRRYSSCLNCWHAIWSLCAVPALMHRSFFNLRLLPAAILLRISVWSVFVFFLNFVLFFVACAYFAMKLNGLSTLPSWMQFALWPEALLLLTCSSVVNWLSLVEFKAKASSKPGDLWRVPSSLHSWLPAGHTGNKLPWKVCAV